VSGRRLGLAIGLVLFWAVAAVAATDLSGILREGERLVYDVTWMGLKGGIATLEAKGLVSVDGAPAYRLVTTAESTPFISTFYRIDDRTESFIQPQPMRTLRFEKHLREGRYRHSSITRFDHTAGAAIFRYLDFGPVPKGITRLEEAEKHGKYVQQEFPLAAGSLDELSVLYYVRGLPLTTGHTLTAKVFASRKSWDLEVRILGRERLDTVLGARETLLVEPLLKFEGIFQQKGRVLVWLTDDAERIPVLMKSEIKIGSFVSTLARRETGGASPRVTGGAATP
jgi:hypothetical protein